jgi:hypothetical protein
MLTWRRTIGPLIVPFISLFMIARYGLSSVVLPNGSVLILGGYDNSINMNDVWRTNDGGLTWFVVTANAPWAGKEKQLNVFLFRFSSFRVLPYRE